MRALSKAVCIRATGEEQMKSLIQVSMVSLNKECGIDSPILAGNNWQAIRCLGTGGHKEGSIIMKN